MLYTYYTKNQYRINNSYTKIKDWRDYEFSLSNVFNLGQQCVFEIQKNYNKIKPKEEKHKSVLLDTRADFVNNKKVVVSEGDKNQALFPHMGP